MGMPAALDEYYTRDMVLALPDDGNRYELVYGELLVSPAPALRHQRVAGRLHARLFVYLEQHDVGDVFFSPADLSWGRDDVNVQPDVFVVAAEDARASKWDVLRNFLLFVEVLSPPNARYDRFTKRRLYQDMHVPLYWVIDPERQRAEIWTPDAVTPVMEEARLGWLPAGTSQAFIIELAELFAP